ncbi:glycoside hydrolase family 105 protein [Pluteus cervinus]|uniref:Glycoside hydrolase family 105 protein n=1 Tax=Pluteus cervinus TaxID=181527 RepID=A0ACD3AW40_9AGAR|nr:glycoside hydrolase family 105 protein [Pluteus cervinus]
MILPPLVAFLFVALSSARPASYAIWAADSAIARRQGNGLDANGNAIVSYEHGEFQLGLRQLFERTGNQTYFDYIRAGVDNIVYNNGTVHGAYSVSEYVLDPLRTGPTMLYLFEQTSAQKYKAAADIFRKQLDSHPRTGEGQFWHKLKYPNQGWLDGVYMGSIFYADYTRTFEPTNLTAWDDITLQFTLMYKNTVQNSTVANSTGLLYHGYDYSHKTVWASSDRGHSPEVWDRALGWYSMALVDALEILPQSHPGYQQILDILHTLVPKIIAAADPTSGVWWLVITQPNRDKNYFESSGSSMFVYSLLKAVRLGLVEDDDGKIVAVAKKAYEYITANWVITNADGTMNWINTVVVGSLDTTGDFNYYVSQSKNLNDLKGLAAFVLASLEIERLEA